MRHSTQKVATVRKHRLQKVIKAVNTCATRKNSGEVSLHCECHIVHCMYNMHGLCIGVLIGAIVLIYHE